MKLLMVILLSVSPVSFAGAATDNQKVICEFVGMGAPNFPEGHLEIDKTTPVITNVQNYGHYRDNYVDEKVASRHLVRWETCVTNRIDKQDVFGFEYDCPLNVNGIVRTIGALSINFETGIGHFRYDLVANSGAVSTLSTSLKKCRQLAD